MISSRSVSALRIASSCSVRRRKELLIGTQDESLEWNFVHANEMRMRLGPSRLRSVRILDVEKRDGGYRVKGAGWGHGVGLCQMGAIGMAQDGKAGREIAAYYYPGATLRRSY